MGEIEDSGLNDFGGFSSDGIKHAKALVPFEDTYIEKIPRAEKARWDNFVAGIKRNSRIITKLYDEQHGRD